MQIRLPLAAAALAVAFAGPAAGATCGDGPEGFPAWVEAFKQEAVAAGISPQVVAEAFAGVSYSPTVIKLDRSQKSFKLSFEEFYARRVNNALISTGKRLANSNANLLAEIERQTGVPPAVILAIWGLETGFGRDSGNMPVIRSLATLAYDCRRSGFFTTELYSALVILERGDMRPEQMIGAWAGEVGQTQFLASSYVKFAVDGDGDGRRDLIRSVPDVLWSTANYLKAYGWRAGVGWGPGEANHEVIRQWNKADVYVRTISVLASEIDRGS